MKFVRNGFFLMAILAVSTLVQAKNIWTDCGIGALVFPDVKWAAVTSNITWDLGTTASSSTSSSEDQCNGKTASVASFIYQNYATLEEETAAGTGDHLVTMLNILGCDASTHGKVIDGIRIDFGKSVATPDYVSKSQREKAQLYYNNTVNSAVGQNCVVI